MLTRREFNRLAIAGAASQVVSPLLAQSGGERKIGYCIIGLGRISMGHFMPGVLASKNSRITGLVSGHRDKALAQAAKYGVPESSIYSYENMDQIKNNSAIDAVYVALPNSMHAEYTIRSAQAGKHVLCEKPMATTVADSLAMIKACKDANKKLMIAYRCHYERAGEWRLDRKLAGGGPLMDMGVYSLNACRYLTGEEPTELKAFSSVIDHDGRFDTVEENVSWTMKFPSGAVASCNTTYGASMNGFYRVHGSLGFLYAEPAFPYQGLHLTAQFSDPAGGKPTILDEPNPDKDPSQFTTQADYFSNCILEDKTPKTAGEEGLLDMQYMSKIYQSAGLPSL
jgi:predicted dehydrogenase